MSGRATAVLDRFPCHLALSDPHKRAGRVVESITSDLDVVTRQIGDVRRAHRLTEAPTTLDVVRIGDLHGLTASASSLIRLRHDALVAADPTDTAMYSVLTNLLSAELDALDDEVRQGAADAVARWSNRHAATTRMVQQVVRSHCIGNGTTVGLLMATAAYLGLRLDPGDVIHSEDRWWHLAPATDLLAVAFAAASPQDDLLAVEENPIRNASIVPTPRRHADRFSVRRGGLDDVVTSIVVVGVGDRTIAPMVVNIDEGTGVVVDTVVPDGAEVVVDVSGHVLLDGTDITGSGFRFAGGVFADVNASHPADMVFGDALLAPTDDDAPRVATFVVTAPISNGFGASPALPHGGSVGGLPLPVGESRWAFFVRVAHYGSTPRTAVARFASGIFDQSVFAGSAGAPGDPSADVGFRWEEREPFAVRVHLPPRLAALDDDDGTKLREPLRSQLGRHRAAGIHLTVAYTEPRWTVGDGVVRPADTSEAIGTVIDGTTLWPDDTPQPQPDPLPT